MAGLMGALTGAMFALFILVALLSMFLKLSCSICREEPPELGKAMLIVFACFIVNVCVGISAYVGLSLAGIAPDSQEARAVESAISLFVQFPIVGLIYSNLIPCSFLKAVLVAFVQYLMMGTVAVVAILLLRAAMGA